MFPDKYRSTIWRFLLNLPDNAINFNDYIRMGTYNSFENFAEKFPLGSDKLCTRMVRILSVFGHYSPVFGDTSFIPISIFPFVSLFDHDELTAFEVGLTFFKHWGQHFFKYYPNPPAEIVIQVFFFLLKKRLKLV